MRLGLRFGADCSSFFLFCGSESAVKYCVTVIGFIAFSATQQEETEEGGDGCLRLLREIIEFEWDKEQKWISAEQAQEKCCQRQRGIIGIRCTFLLSSIFFTSA